LRVDLSDKYISVDTLTNTESPAKLTTTRKLAAGSGAVAAVNSSFFSYDKNGLGNPLGPIVKSGELLAASSDFNKYSDSIASFSLTKLNKVLYEYWKTDIYITAPNGKAIPIARYNKANGSSFTDFTILDSKWGKTSIGVSERFNDIVEMLVVDDKVVNIYVAEPPLQIPENGYVVVTRKEGGKLLADYFDIGDPVKLTMTTTPNWDNYKMSITGSSILVKDGEIPEKFSYAPSDIAASSPKTAVGTTKDGKQLIAVTVDGRQNSSIGLTMEEMALFMKSIGAYNAINMDGGGSTTMVARKLSNKTVDLINSPSDGRERGISTALGIYSTAPASELAGLVIETDGPNVFVFSSKTFSVKGYDKYKNPVDVDPSSVKWSVSGVKGTFKGNTFYPTTFGEARVYAKVGNATGSIPISVLSLPVRLELSSSLIKLQVGKTASISVTGYNRNGFTAAINPADLTWTASEGIGTIENGVFTAKARGAGYIGASFKGVEAFCPVTVASASREIRDDFESENGSFRFYPEIVTGSYEISAEKAYSGKSSGKLTYDFPESEVTRAAYYVLPGDGLVLEPETSRIGLQVYNDHETSNWLRAEIIDSNGQKQVVDLARNVDWTGWKYVEASTEKISLPARLTRIYLVQVNPVADNGSIYLDDLQTTLGSYPAIDPEKIPKDTVPEDPQNIIVNFSKATSDSFRFAVFGQSHEPENEAQQLIADKYAEKVNKYVDVAVIVGKGSHQNLAKAITEKPVVATVTEDIPETEAVDYKYSYTDVKNSRFFIMDMREKGLRLSDPTQWQQFLKGLYDFKGKHAFILLENSPSSFSDSLEMQLFKETLTEYWKKSGKTVWVIYKGDTNECRLERGIKYFSTKGYDVEGLTTENTDPAIYLLVTIKGDNITYAYKTVI
jgi:exopolysaccharide biosynthesis protein